MDAKGNGTDTLTPVVPYSDTGNDDANPEYSEIQEELSRVDRSLTPNTREALRKDMELSPRSSDLRRQSSTRQRRRKSTAYVRLPLRSKWVIDPRTSWFVRRWDPVLMVLLMFTAIVTPFEVSFLKPTINLLFFVNRCVDCLFLVDIGLNFTIAFWDAKDNTYVFDHKVIAKRYMKSWFCIDLVSILPFDSAGLFMQNDSVNAMRVVRMVRLLRLAKLLRIMRAGRIMNRLESSMSIDYSSMRLTMFMVVLVVLGHWMACFLHLVQDMEGAEENWLTAYGMSGASSTPDKYTVALYWAIMTTSTIGYGDVVPVTLSERVYYTLMMLVGAFAYGYIIGAVSNIIATRDSKRNEFYTVMDELNYFMAESRLDGELQVQLRDYFRYRAQTAANVDSYKQLLERMSPELRGRVALHTNQAWISNVQLFKNCPTDFVVAIALSLTQNTYSPGELIIQVGSAAKEMFIVVKGMVSSKGRVFTGGSTVGEECLFYKEGRRAYTARAIRYVDAYALTRQRTMEVLDLYPEVALRFRSTVRRLVFRQEVFAYAEAYFHVINCKTEFSGVSLFGDANDRVQHYMQKLQLTLRKTALETDQLNKAAHSIQQRFKRYSRRRQMRGVRGSQIARLANENVTNVMLEKRLLDMHTQLLQAMDNLSTRLLAVEHTASQDSPRLGDSTSLHLSPMSGSDRK